MNRENRKIEQWPVNRLVPHPDNPRTVRTKTAEYKELVDSVNANGVIEPLLVRVYRDPNEALDAAREAVGAEFRQVLSGHHRLRAAQDAGLECVPVVNLGALPDTAAYDIVAMGNIRVPLTPLEEGKRAATWLDKYGQDAQAVAGKLGQTPRWVVEHAQIARGLTADWHKAAAEIPAFDRWTSSHWAVIAKLPARIQAEQLSKFRNNAFCSYDRWTVKELESRIGLQTFLLSKAPFDTAGCQNCVNRSGVQPLLWADTVEESTGAKERCLDRKCYQRKAEKAERDAFRQTVTEKGLADAVPLSMLQEPGDHWGKPYEEYRKKVSSCRRAHKGLVTADQVKIVKETTPGAVPAIIVAGVGKGTTKWVKVKPAKENSLSPGKPRPPSAKDIEREKEAERWDRVCNAAEDKIRQMPAPSAEVILLVQSLMDAPVPDLSEIDDLVRMWQKDRDRFGQKVRDWFWQAIVNPRFGGTGMCFIEGERETLEQLGPVLGIDIEADYQALAEADAKEESLRAKTEIVPVELPKSLKAKCELRLLGDGGKWYGGFLIEVPKARADLPVDTRGDAYETKTACVLSMVERVRHELTGFKLKKSCPGELFKKINGELDNVVKACELELQRSGQGSTPASCSGDCAGCGQLGTCNGAQLPGKAANVKPTGLIEDPERVRVELPEGINAAVTIKLGQVDQLWYVGWDAHVPGAGNTKPCSTAHNSYPSRNEALAAACGEIGAWLDGKPGKKGYKHHDKIKEFTETVCQAARDTQEKPASGKPVMRCTFPLPAREPIAEPKSGERKCRVCRKMSPECTHCAGTVCPVCQWEEADLCAACAAQGKGGPQKASAKSIASGRITSGLEPRAKGGQDPVLVGCNLRVACPKANECSHGKPHKMDVDCEVVQICPDFEAGGRSWCEPVSAVVADRNGPPAVDAPRILEMTFPGNYETTCRVLCQRIEGQWFGGYDLRALFGRVIHQIRATDKPFPAKAACLTDIQASLRKWLMQSAGSNRQMKSRAVQIAARIEEAIEEELKKRTCRECGCTEDDCQACTEAMGAPCHWVEDDLCSRCQGQS